MHIHAGTPRHLDMPTFVPRMHVRFVTCICIFMHRYAVVCMPLCMPYISHVWARVWASDTDALNRPRSLIGSVLCGTCISHHHTPPHTHTSTIQPTHSLPNICILYTHFCIFEHVYCMHNTSQTQ